MQKSVINTTPRNPFAEGRDEKEVWKELLKKARPIKKSDFLKKIGKGV
jgi:hypothetical protein